MNKAQFQKLPKWKQRVHIAKDVIKQIEAKKLLPLSNNVFVEFIKGGYENTYNSDGLLIDRDPKPLLNILNEEVQCEVCAKGALFMSYCNINNELNTLDADHGGLDSTSQTMKELSKTFPYKQLALLETAFEGFEVDRNRSHSGGISASAMKKAIAYHNIFYKRRNSVPKNAAKFMIQICENIIKNKGTFKP